MKIPVRFPIEAGKTYYTRSGREVRIYATDGCGNYPIHGAVRYDNGWEFQRWRFDGIPFLTSNHQIVAEEKEWAPDDKELVWCWDDDTEFGRILKFYDAKNCVTYNANNGRRNASGFDHYAPFEGEYPEWAKVAKKKLEE